MLIDMTTSEPALGARDLRRGTRARRAALDAPVRAATSAAREARLSIMVGGRSRRVRADAAAPCLPRRTIVLRVRPAPAAYEDGEPDPDRRPA